MQPSKITILGDFFDCQIYRGRLYLWTLSGDIYTCLLYTSPSPRD